jgi:hypothetical protein
MLAAGTSHWSNTNSLVLEPRIPSGRTFHNQVHVVRKRSHDFEQIELTP